MYMCLVGDSDWLRQFETNEVESHLCQWDMTKGCKQP